MASNQRPIQGTLGFHDPRPVPYGHITLAVDHVKFQPFGIGHANYFRPSTQQKPLVSLHRDYYVEESDQPVGHPMSIAYCSAEFHPATTTAPASVVPALQDYLEAVEQADHVVHFTAAVYTFGWVNSISAFLWMVYDSVSG